MRSPDAIDGRPTVSIPQRASPADPICVLHVDDDRHQRTLLSEYLGRGDREFRVETAADVDAGIDVFEAVDLDCVVSDYQMPGADGLEFLERVRSRRPEMPFILFTGQGNEEIASDAISAGVTDYLQKGGGGETYTLLANRIENAVGQYRSRRALAARERSLRRAQRIAGLGNWDWNLERGSLYWSDQIYRIFGVEPEEFEATYDAFLEFVHSDDRETVTSAVDAALAGERQYEVRHRIVRPDGTVRWVDEEAEVTRSESGDPITMTGTVNDITERVDRQRELRAHREAVEHAGHSIYWTDPDGVIEYANEAFEETTGYDREEVVGRTPRVLKSGHHDESFYADLWETITGGDVWQSGIVNERKNGEHYRVRQTITPIENDDGEPVRYVAVNIRAT